MPQSIWVLTYGSASSSIGEGGGAEGGRGGEGGGFDGGSVARGAHAKLKVLIPAQSRMHGPPSHPR